MNPLPEQRKSTSRVLTYTLALALIAIFTSLTVANRDLRIQLRKDWKSLVSSTTLRLLELAGETPKTVPIAIIGVPCESITEEDHCNSIPSCQWSSMNEEEPGSSCKTQQR